MFESLSNQLFLLGSISFATVSLAIPPPISSSGQDAVVDSLSKPIAIEQQAQVAEERSLKSEKLQTGALPPLSLPTIVTEPQKNTEAAESNPKDYELAALPLLLTSVEHQSDADTEKVPLPEESAAQSSLEESPPVVNPVIGVANRIVVPTIGIDLAVRPGGYDAATKTWVVDDTAAYHADTTVPVNDTNGTTLIYGHAKWGVFGTLPDVSVGAEAIVHSEDGSEFIYTLDTVQQVDPNDVTMLTPEGPPRLILQTCSGLFDQHRTLAIFNFKEIVGKE